MWKIKRGSFSDMRFENGGQCGRTYPSHIFRECPPPRTISQKHCVGTPGSQNLARIYAWCKEIQSRVSSCCGGLTMFLGATIFFGMGGSWISGSTSAIFLWPSPYLMIKNFMTPPIRSYNVEEICNPPMRVARKICILGAISLNKIFI